MIVGADDQCLFGLGKLELLTVVQNIAGEPVESFDLSARNDLQGCKGYSGQDCKRTVTFSYITQSRKQAKATVFVKRSSKPESAELRHYGWLTDLGVPTPHVYGAVADSEGREILFIEALTCLSECPPFTEFLSNAPRVREFLAVIARLNAARLAEDHTQQIRQISISGALPYGISHCENTWEKARKGELGDALQALCLSRPEGLDRLCKLATSLIETTARMPFGLCHADYSPAQIGMRHGTGEMLIVDLESLALAPRFFDLASVLGAPEANRPATEPRRELARCYLERYIESGGDAVSVDELLRETHILWMAEAFTGMWWHADRCVDGKTDWTEDADEGRRIYREKLYATLSTLLEEAG